MTTVDLPPGLDLARCYWREAVRPVLEVHVPRVPRAAARVGTGSDVLGLDDVMSRDHDWGLRLQVFVPRESVTHVADALMAHLPAAFYGLPTSFAFTGETTPHLALDVLTVQEFAAQHAGFDPRSGPTTLDWLSLSGQAALQLTGGEVFEDGPGDLTAVRSAMSWYPNDLWRYIVATDWQRIDQELPLMSRAGDRGDDLGSRVIAARLADIATHLAFTISRRWCPYAKWRGLMLRGLPCGPAVTEALAAVVAAGEWGERQQAMGFALDLLVDLQRAAGLPATGQATQPFWDRPYLQVHQGLVDAVTDAIVDDHVRALPRGLGSAEQRTDNVDLLVDPARRRALVADGIPQIVATEPESTR